MLSSFLFALHPGKNIMKQHIIKTIANVLKNFFRIIISPVKRIIIIPSGKYLTLIEDFLPLAPRSPRH